MRYKVPQNVDIEDTIIGSLTAKQFLWIMGAAGLLYVVYQFVDFSLFLIFVVFIGGTAVVFAFIRPYGQSMFSFTGNFFMYLFKGKEYFWERGKAPFKSKKKTKKQDEIVIVKKQFPDKTVEELANVLDTQGNIFDDAVINQSPQVQNKPSQTLQNKINYNKTRKTNSQDKINPSQTNFKAKQQNQPKNKKPNIEKALKNKTNQNIKQVEELNISKNNLYQ
ncbi:MAG: hypothetical protein GF335_04290 [Candidatus Moranbacteria bacterium]|nr:hypothetical protein [Candidatus Moranbacteria bacterium]